MQLEWRDRACVVKSCSDAGWHLLWSSLSFTLPEIPLGLVDRYRTVEVSILLALLYLGYPSKLFTGI